MVGVFVTWSTFSVRCGDATHSMRKAPIDGALRGRARTHHQARNREARTAVTYLGDAKQKKVHAVTAMRRSVDIVAREGENRLHVPQEIRGAVRTEVLEHPNLAYHVLSERGVSHSKS